MAEEEKEEAVEGEGAEKSGGKKKLIIIIALAVVLLGGIGAGAFFFFAGGDESEEVVEEEVGPQPATYLNLEPQFVINYDVAGRDRFMQVYVTVMSRDIAAIDAIGLHMPLIRNNLVRAMGTMDFDSLRTPAGKEQLRVVVQTEINAVLKQETGAEGVESILFTNLVMQ